MQRVLLGAVTGLLAFAASAFAGATLDSYATPVTGTPLGSPSSSLASALVYDAVSDLTTFTTTTSTPHTYTGQAFSVSNAGGATPTITDAKAGLFVVGAQSVAGVRLRLQFWGAYNGAGAATDPVFSSPVGAPLSFDLGPVTTTGNGVFVVTLTGLNVTLPSTSNLGIAFNWMTSTDGINYVDNTNFVTAMRAPVNTMPIPVGTNATVGGQYYRNAGSESNFNFLTSSVRSIGGTNPNDGLAFQLTATAVPEPATATVMGLATLAVGLRRRR